MLVPVRIGVNPEDLPLPFGAESGYLGCNRRVINSIMTRYNFIVIGSGPAGRRAAIQAAKLGHDVLVVEKGRRVGGVVQTGYVGNTLDRAHR
jgi:NADPH-dependent 2,4-dienoyl-CoA reductase/sulfur reductase-like enzyme